MDNELPELSREAVADALGRFIIERITEDTISCLQDMEATLSGESGLLSVWEEICVQAQSEHSTHWDTYVSTMRDFVEGSLQVLKRHELEAAWLVSPEGECWESSESEPYPAVSYSDNLSAHILDDVIMERARKYESPSLLAYLESGVHDE